MARMWGLALGVLVGCGSPPEVELGDIVGTATMSWSGSKGPVRGVFQKAGTADEQVTPFTHGDSSDHSIPLLGLQAGQTYEAWVETEGGRTSDSVEFTVQPPPQGVPRLTLDVSEPSKMCQPDGYVLFSYLGRSGSGVAIVDREAKYVWAYENDVEGTSITRPRPGRDGQTILWNLSDEERIEDKGAIVGMELDGSNRVQSRALWAHHDFVEHPDGTLAWNGYCFFDALIEGKKVPTAGEMVVEGPVGATSIDENTVIWNQCETWPYPWAVNNTGFLPGFNSYGHGNSIAYLPEDDSYLIMMRWIDTLAKISSDGELVWLLGGEYSDFTGVEDDIFLHSHFSDAWYDGDGVLQLYMFDNQLDPGPSRLGRYSIDEKAMSYTLDWSVGLDYYENLLGDVRRMGTEGCDNRLISFSTQGRLVEMTPEGEIVWEAQSAQGATTRVTFLPDLYDMTGAAYP